MSSPTMPESPRSDLMAELKQIFLIILEGSESDRAENEQRFFNVFLARYDATNELTELEASLGFCFTTGFCDKALAKLIFDFCEKFCDEPPMEMKAWVDTCKTRIENEKMQANLEKKRSNRRKAAKVTAAVETALEEQTDKVKTPPPATVLTQKTPYTLKRLAKGLGQGLGLRKKSKDNNKP